MKKIDIDRFEIKIPEKKLRKAEHTPLRAAIVSDLHGRAYGEVIKVLAELSPDLILAPGDIIENGQTDHKLGVPFLKEAAKLAPVYYSSGNHELILSEIDLRTISDAGVFFCDGRMHTFKKGAVKITVGGMPPAETNERRYRRTTVFNMFANRAVNKATLRPDTVFLQSFSEKDGYKIMLCHHPEYYEPFLRDLDIDLVCSGHAHGGQIRLFGRGIFSPGQGFFPKYTSGIYEGRLVVSRGLVNHSFAPRLFNPPHIILLTLR